MPEYLAPGVYVEEISSAPPPIAGVGTVYAFNAISFVTIIVALLLMGCAQTSVYDTVYDHSAHVEGAAVSAVDAPAGFVGQAWAAPYEQKAEDITLADWRRMFSINADGPFLGTRLAITAMKATGGGSIFCRPMRWRNCLLASVPAWRS